MKVQILFNHILRATQSFWRLRVEGEEKEISQIYIPDKDCKFWAGLLLRNDAHLLSFIAPGCRLAITNTLSSPIFGNSRAITVDIEFFIDLLISETAYKACP